MAIPVGSSVYCKSSLELSRDMTGGRLLTKDRVEVLDRTRLDRGAEPEAVAELPGDEGGCSELLSHDGIWEQR